MLLIPSNDGMKYAFSPCFDHIFMVRAIALGRLGKALIDQPQHILIKLVARKARAMVNRFELAQLVAEFARA